MLAWIALALADPAVGGRYELVETYEVMHARHEAAIRESLRALPWAARPFARGPLQRTVTNCVSFELDLSEDRFWLHCLTEPEPYEQARSEPEVDFVDDGTAVHATLDVDDDGVVLAFDTRMGGLSMVYEPQGQELVQRKVMTSPWMDGAVVWEARYRRVSP